MKKYARTPLLLVSLWWIRATIIFTLSLVTLEMIFPTLHDAKTTPKIPSKETVIALDISKSMETDDILPSRIEFAKNFLHDRTLTLGHVGFIIFAGKTFVLSPITTDTRGLNYLIETLHTDTINQSEAETSGTNIGDALIQASTLFAPLTKEKQVILITDGRANIGLDPLIASESLKEKNIAISIIALGSATGSTPTHLVDGRREPLLDGSGNTINGSVDIASLDRIASSTRGTLVHISK
jgi:Ca-activated chloride channel family protein